MPSIQSLWEKIKGFGRARMPIPNKLPDDLFLGLILVLVAFGSFGLGRLSGMESTKTPIRIENSEVRANDALGGTSGTIQEGATSEEQLVGSKTGTKYYYPWCGGVQKISPANLVYFKSKTEAEARGYTASTACKGL